MTAVTHAEQRMRNLARADQIRLGRARLKRDLRAGRADLAKLLVQPPELLAGAAILDLLVTLPAVGRIRASKALASLGISVITRVDELTLDQRLDIALWARGRRQGSERYAR